ncbi:hypothetical protein R1flu_006345 [Riccia fluitans]|uniref:Uncharacterized protein n=1 Tax=Riccia fluitans TaxID=41844 RepID=A0ABD1YWE3_9MARC
MTSSEESQKKPLTSAGGSNRSHASAATSFGHNHSRVDERVCSNQEESGAAAAAIICEGGEQSSCSKRPRATTTAGGKLGEEQEVESPERPCKDQEGRRVKLIASSAGSINQCSSSKGKALIYEQDHCTLSVFTSVPTGGMSKSNVKFNLRSDSSTRAITDQKVVVNEVMESPVDDVRGSCSMHTKSTTTTLKIKMTSVFGNPCFTGTAREDELLSTASFYKQSDVDADADESDNDAASACYMKRVDTMESEVGSSNITTSNDVGIGCLHA